MEHVFNLIMIIEPMFVISCYITKKNKADQQFMLQLFYGIQI